METTFICGINLLAAVPTTLRSVWFASYTRPLKDSPRNKLDIICIHMDNRYVVLNDVESPKYIHDK